MSNDDRHPLVRFFAWVEEKHPWVHLVLLAVAVSGSIVAVIKLYPWVSSRETKNVFTIFSLACFLACAGYAEYIVQLRLDAYRRRQPIMSVAVKAVGYRREVIPSRGRDKVFCYCAFKPLDGASPVTLRIPEMDYDRYPAGTVGLLRYRAGEFLSFTPAKPSKEASA